MKMGLGTVQFGLDYGISNRAGQVSMAAIEFILECARLEGVDLLDTAIAYGEAEQVLGRCRASERGFAIVTKLPPVPDPAPADVLAWVQREFEASCERLNTANLHGLMLHRASDLLGPCGDAIWHAMQVLRDAGRVQAIGASVYDGAEVDALVKRFDLSLVQVPINLLDQRLIAGGQLERLKERDVEVHARSLLLQGLLLMDPETVSAHFDATRPVLRSLREAASGQGVSLLQAVLGFAATVPQLDRVIIGVTSVDELRSSLAALRGPGLPDYREFAMLEPSILNPALWPPRT